MRHCFVCPAHSWPKSSACKSLAAILRLPHKHVIENRQTAKRASQLKRSNEAVARDPMRRPPSDSTAVEMNAAGVGVLEAADHAEQGRLSRPPLGPIRAVIDRRSTVKSTLRTAGTPSKACECPRLAAKG